MARKSKNSNISGDDNVFDLRHAQSSRINIPPAGLVARGTIDKEEKCEYAFNPHLYPILRFDDSRGEDQILELINATKDRILTDEEIIRLSLAFNNHQPWLEWTGKKEQSKCVVDPVALNIHERISAQAVIAAARRQDVQRNIFADPDMDYSKSIQFYKHPMDWTNRLILGDSLAVMASLARREALAGKVQMIYMDPPYGISYNSNFMPDVFSRDVKDSDDHLTREIETVKAYRDTWKLGVHSYLSYLRERLLLCRELLSDSGSIFVQISIDNVHLVRNILDELFGKDNFITMINFRRKINALNPKHLGTVNDYLLFYAKNKVNMKFRRLYQRRVKTTIDNWGSIELGNNYRGRLPKKFKENPEDIPTSARLFASYKLAPAGFNANSTFSVEYNGKEYLPPFTSGGRSWKHNKDGIIRLLKAQRVIPQKDTLRYLSYEDDFPYSELDHSWEAAAQPSSKVFVVQTAEDTVKKCMLMTTDPGDIVLDPTCGGATTATVAETLGRRWITIDISRIAITIAKQRILTQTYPYFKLIPTSALDIQRNANGVWLRDPQGIIPGSCTIACESAPHITPGSIANNQAIDSVYDKWRPIITEKISIINEALMEIDESLKKQLISKFDKQSKNGDLDYADLERMQLTLPPFLKRDYHTVSNDYKGWYEWEIPYEPSSEYPVKLSNAIRDYWSTYNLRKVELNKCIEVRADQEELFDQPIIDSSCVRVSGPFTIEGIIPVERSIDELPADSIDSCIQDTSDRNSVSTESKNLEAFLVYVIKWLRENGIQVDSKTQYRFEDLEQQPDGSVIQAAGSWVLHGVQRQVAVTVGPQYGAINALIVENSIRLAARRGFDDLVFAAFSFEGSAQAIIQQDQDPKLRIHLAHISPDVNMGDLLKNSQTKSLFTITGSPRITLDKVKDGDYVVKMEGVDIYDPITNSILPTMANKVAAWFLDTDYDGKCFCICQAFFPDRNAWNSISKALKNTIDNDYFELYSGTVSIPFSPGKYRTIAVKVIDPRGNEVISIERLA